MKTKKFGVGFVLFFLAGVGFASDVAIHPTPKEPKLIANDLLADFKRGIILPPKEKSADQRADEVELLALQKSRSSADCARAKAEVYVGLAAFYGEPLGPLTATQVETYKTFFDQVRNDADFYIQLLKKEFPRPRPFLYVKGLEPCVLKEITGAYPSGHATLARLYAMILTDLFPKRKAAFLARSDVIARDRVVAGVHHPSDIRAGTKLGELVYAEMKKSGAYRKLFDSLPKP